MSKYKRLGKNTLFVFLGNVGSKFISFFLLPFYTTWLSPSEYGAIDIITVYTTLILGLATANISDGIFIFPKGRSIITQKSYFSSGFFFSILSLIVLAVVFSIINFFSYKESHLGTFGSYIWPIYFIILSNLFQRLTQQFSRSIDKIKVYAYSGLVYTILFSILSFILVKKYTLIGFVISQIAAQILSAFFTFFVSKSYIFLDIKSISKNHLKEMLIYTIPLIPNSIMWWLINALNRPILEEYVGTDGVGLFAVANKFPSLIVVFFTIFTYSWQISVMEEFKKPNFHLFYNRIFKIVFFSLFVVSLFLGILSKPLLNLFVNVRFFEAWYLIPLLSLAVLFSSVSSFVGMNFSATKESKYFFYSSMWGGVCSLLFNFLLIPSYGLIGASISIVIANFIMVVSRIIYSWRFCKIFNLEKYAYLVLVYIIIFIPFFYKIEVSLYLIVIFSLIVILFLLFKREVYFILSQVKKIYN